MPSMRATDALAAWKPYSQSMGTQSEDKEEEVDEDRGNASARGGFDITMSYLVFPEVFLRCE